MSLLVRRSQVKLTRGEGGGVGLGGGGGGGGTDTDKYVRLKNVGFMF